MKIEGGTMYKLIVTDMDGTFLNSFGEIPVKNLEVVNKAVDLGVEFAIVTGRPYVSVKKLLEDNGLSCFVIGCNGAQVTDREGRLVKAHYINRESLIAIMKSAEDKDLYYQLYDDRYIYTRSRLQLLKMLKNYSGKSVRKHITLKRILGGIKRLFFIEVRVKPNLMEFVQNNDMGFYKIQIASLSRGELDKMLPELRAIPDVDITSSNYFNLEIGPKDINKGTALKELAEIGGIEREQIMAMGDNLNDVPMLVYAGCGIAMENAEEEVKSKAKFITKSNDDNGVAYAIDQLLLKTAEPHKTGQ